MRHATALSRRIRSQAGTPVASSGRNFGRKPGCPVAGHKRPGRNPGPRALRRGATNSIRAAQCLVASWY
eukprot:11072066-Alexandrium_andersonii.AAC.1